MIDNCMFLCCMVSTLKWLRPEANVSSQPTCCRSVTLPLKCCSSQVSPCLAWDVQRVGCGMVWTSRAHSAPRNVTRHELRLSAYPRDPMTPHPWQRSVSSHEKSIARMSSMTWLSHPVLSSLAIHAQLIVPSEPSRPHFAHGSGACGYQQNPRHDDHWWVAWRDWMISRQVSATGVTDRRTLGAKTRLCWSAGG